MATVKKPITKAVTEEKPVVATPAAKEVEVKKVEVKAEVKKEEPKKEVKKAAAKPAAKKAPAKQAAAKTEVKAEAKAEAKKPAAKATAEKKAPAKKVEAKTFVQVELDHVNYTEESLIKIAKKAYKDSKKKEALKDLKVYFNTNERKLYVVPNNNIEEQIVVDLRLQ